jgi:hypothetical protein
MIEKNNVVMIRMNRIFFEANLPKFKRLLTKLKIKGWLCDNMDGEKYL